MATVNYTKIAEQVTKALNIAGADAVLIVEHPGAFDPATGGYANDGPPTEHKFRGIQFDITEEFADLFAPGILEQGDKVIFGNVPKDFVDPSTGNSVRFAGSEWAVISVNPLNPAGIDVLYQYQVRGPVT